MHDIPLRIADILLEVEATLRRHGKWEAVQPPGEALASTQPFSLDTLRFEQWLQWIFLPRMKWTIEQTRPLPANSEILPYAEERLHKRDPATAPLLHLIGRFDELISIQAAARHH